MTESQEGVLADGGRPAGAEDLFRRLRELGISFETVDHPAVFTVEQAKALRGELPGCHVKNLFLRDRKGAMWLVVCREDRAIDLKVLAGLLGAGRLSFGSPERLMKYLGVIPGAVTPFAVINDKGGQVRVVLERRMLETEPLNFHPLDNAMTTAIGADDFVRFLEAESHAPEYIDLG
ncbi:MAG: DNA-binding protein [Gemmatimonas sp. SM23_52]|nr:MAG: DNA-binding protein [Gemmatimonas sp. SM23_52]